MKRKFVVRTFKDKERFCRVPIFLGGERQIHIMQPYKGQGDRVEPPKNADEWFKLMEKHGQIVFSLSAVDDFIGALISFKKELEAVNPRKRKGGM